MPDDYPATTDTTATVSVGGTATGEIETPDDRDWFAVEFVAGRHYRIDLEGADTFAGTLADPFLRGVHDARGGLVSGTFSDISAGENEWPGCTAAVTGAHRISAGPKKQRTADRLGHARSP